MCEFLLMFTWGSSDWVMYAQAQGEGTPNGTDLQKEDSTLYFFLLEIKDNNKILIINIQCCFNILDYWVCLDFSL